MHIHMCIFTNIFGVTSIRNNERHIYKNAYNVDRQLYKISFMVIKYAYMHTKHIYIQIHNYMQNGVLA